MSWIGTVNLIRALDWYLLVIFVASSVLRLRQYRSLLARLAIPRSVAASP